MKRVAIGELPLAEMMQDRKAPDAVPGPSFLRWVVIPLERRKATRTGIHGEPDNASH
jgi:hypothetical protein